MYTAIVSKKQKVNERQSNEFGQLIRAKRKLDRISIRDAAERIGIGNGGLSELENGKRNPEWETIVKIHDGLDIPIEDMIRAAAKDQGIAMPERSNQELIEALNNRAAAFPDLLGLLRLLEGSDPASYRAFLRMFRAWQAQSEQDDEPPS